MRRTERPCGGPRLFARRVTAARYRRTSVGVLLLVLIGAGLAGEAAAAERGASGPIKLRDNRRVCVEEKLDLRGGGFGLTSGAVANAVRYSVQRQLSAIGQGRVSGRKPSAERVLALFGSSCDPGTGDLKLTVTVRADRAANTYAVTIAASDGRRIYHDSITRPDAIARVHQGGYGPVDGPRPGPDHWARYVPTAITADASGLADRFTGSLTFIR